MTVNIYDFQKLGTEQLESNTTAASSFLDTLQAIAAEASDYSRRSLENRFTFVAKLLGAKTFESAIQIQSEHAKTSYEGFIAYLKKMTDLRANLAKEFFKPIETAITKVQTFSANDASKVRAIMDRDVRIHSKDLIETLRKRIVELEDLEARGAATPDTCEMLVELHELLDKLQTMLSERAGRTSH